MADEARVIVDKPFGRDLASARELNRIARSVFPEDSIFRIDHFLGKEAIMNTLYFRFANSFLEPIWTRNHVVSVQITLSENFGVEKRGAFYETAECLRDVIENHLFQVVALLAMEPPDIGALAPCLAREPRLSRPCARFIPTIWCAGREFVGDQQERYLFEGEQPGEQNPYERLLEDALTGDGALFTREDAVEAAWAVVEPVLQTHHRSHLYQRGSWDPQEADLLIAREGHSRLQPLIDTEKVCT